MINEFNVPWYAWPTTAAVVAFLLGIIGIYWNYLCQRHLKTLESVTRVVECISKGENGLIQMLLPSPNLGTRFEAGWDVLHTLMIVDVGIAIQSLIVYSNDKKIDRLCDEILEASKKAYSNIFRTVISATVEGISSEERINALNRSMDLDVLGLTRLNSLSKELYMHVKQQSISLYQVPNPDEY